MFKSVHHITTKSANHPDNEDAMYIGRNFIIVADGMGGESNGRLASSMAIDNIASYLETALEKAPVDMPGTLCAAIDRADNDIGAYIDAHPQAAGMGTTVAVIACLKNKICVAWCGDTRCYTFNDGQLQAVTTDHSYVQQLVDQGVITVEQSFSHPDNNLVTRYVGGGPDMCQPDFAEFDVREGQTILVCTDGLSGYCRYNEIAHVMATCTRPSALPGALTRLALDHGSDDDITIVTCTCGDGSDTSPIGRWFGRLRRKHRV